MLNIVSSVGIFLLSEKWSVKATLYAFCILVWSLSWLLCDCLAGHMLYNVTLPEPINAFYTQHFICWGSGIRICGPVAAIRCLVDFLSCQLFWLLCVLLFLCLFVLGRGGFFYTSSFPNAALNDPPPFTQSKCNIATRKALLYVTILYLRWLMQIIW